MSVAQDELMLEELKSYSYSLVFAWIYICTLICLSFMET